MPIINFKARDLDALKTSPPKIAVEYWDETTPGFGLRVSQGGSKVWIVRYKVRKTGVMDRVTLFSFESTPLERARRLAVQYLHAASRGINLKQTTEPNSIREYLCNKCQCHFRVYDILTANSVRCPVLMCEGNIRMLK